MLRDQESFLYVCSFGRYDFVGELGEDFAEDLVGDLRGEDREDEDLFSLISGSVFFLGEDLVKRPISEVKCNCLRQLFYFNSSKVRKVGEF